MADLVKVAPDTKTLVSQVQPLTVTEQTDTIPSNFTTSSTSYVDVTNAAITVANRSGGKFQCSVSTGIQQQTTQNVKVFMTIGNDGTDELGSATELDNITLTHGAGISAIGDLDGRVLKARVKVEGGQMLVQNLQYQMVVLEISGGNNLAAQRVDSTADFSTSSTSYVDVTNISLTIGNFPGGKYVAHASATPENSAVAGLTHTQLVHDSTEYIGASTGNPATDANDELTQNTVLIEDTDGSILKMQARVTSGTGTLRHVANTNGHFITTLEFKGSNTITTDMKVLTSDFDTASATYVDITGMIVTLQSSGKFYIICSLPCSNNFDGGTAQTTISFGGTEGQDFTIRNEDTARRPTTVCACFSGDAGGEILKLRGRRQAGGTSRWHGDTIKACRMAVLQID